MEVETEYVNVPTTKNRLHTMSVFLYPVLSDNAPNDGDATTRPRLKAATAQP